jgi:hypothetical protein
MKWQNSSHLYCTRFSKRARELVLRKWSDAGMPPSEMLPASTICQVSVPPSLLPFLAWKLLLNYVNFTIFVSQPRVRPRTPLDAVIETTWPNVRSIMLGARLPHKELDLFVGAHPPLHPAAAPSSFFCGGRSSNIFIPTLFCRSLLMMHLTQQSRLLHLEMQQICALTTMFAVEDSSGNNCSDNNDGWESNDGCNAMVKMTRA